MNTQKTETVQDQKVKQQDENAESKFQKLLSAIPESIHISTTHEPFQNTATTTTTAATTILTNNVNDDDEYQNEAKDDEAKDDDSNSFSSNAIFITSPNQYSPQRSSSPTIHYPISGQSLTGKSLNDETSNSHQRINARLLFNRQQRSKSKTNPQPKMTHRNNNNGQKHQQMFSEAMNLNSINPSIYGSIGSVEETVVGSESDEDSINHIRSANMEIARLRDEAVAEVDRTLYEEQILTFETEVQVLHDRKNDFLEQLFRIGDDITECTQLSRFGMEEFKRIYKHMQIIVIILTSVAVLLQSLNGILTSFGLSGTNNNSSTITNNAVAGSINEQVRWDINLAFQLMVLILPAIAAFIASLIQFNKWQEAVDNMSTLDGRAVEVFKQMKRIAMRLTLVEGQQQFEEFLRYFIENDYSTYLDVIGEMNNCLTLIEQADRQTKYLKIIQKMRLQIVDHEQTLKDLMRKEQNKIVMQTTNNNSNGESK